MNLFPKDLTAQSLYALVNDVPREWWPEHYEYDDNEYPHHWRSITPEYKSEMMFSGTSRRVDETSLAFIGHITGRLAEHGLYLVPVYHVHGRADGCGFQLFSSVKKHFHLETKSGTVLPGENLLEALIEAAKAVGKEM